jgi:hypothetical protein
MRAFVIFTVATYSLGGLLAGGYIWYMNKRRRERGGGE